MPTNTILKPYDLTKPKNISGKYFQVAQLMSKTPCQKSLPSKASLLNLRMILICGAQQAQPLPVLSPIAPCPPRFERASTVWGRYLVDDTFINFFVHDPNTLFQLFWKIYSIDIRILPGYRLFHVFIHADQVVHGFDRLQPSAICGMRFFQTNIHVKNHLPKLRKLEMKSFEARFRILKKHNIWGQGSQQIPGIYLYVNIHTYNMYIYI